MLSDKAVLIEQIKTEIKKRLYNNNSDFFQDSDISPDQPNNNHHNNITGYSHKDHLAHSFGRAVIKKLEERTEKLEFAYDQLFNFVNFLIELLPELVLDILQSERCCENEYSSSIGRNDNCEKAFGLNSILNKEYPNLTKREKEVLKLLVKGFCAKEIASKLFISETTVITHKKNLKEKFFARNTVELVSNAHSILSRSDK